MMKKILRTLVLIALLTGAIFVGQKMWLEFHEMSSAERIQHPLHKKTVDVIRQVFGFIPLASAHFALANSFQDEGLQDRAVEEYQRTLQMDKLFPQAYLDLAGIYLERGSLKEAVELLQKAEVAIPNNPDITKLKKQASYEYFCDAGVNAFEKGDLFGARELLNNALAADPDSAQAHYLLSLSFDEQLNFEQVQDHLMAAIRLDPKFYLARSALGDLYFGNGNFEAAIRQYEVALAIFGNNPVVLNNMGLAYMNLERYDLAIPCLEKALASDPENVERRHNLAAVYRDRGMLDKATKGFLDVIRMKPDYPNVHNDLGDIYRKQGRNQEALREYRATVEQGLKRLGNFSDPVLLVELAYAYSELKEYDHAKKLVEEALRVNSSDYMAYWTLANIYRNLNQPEAELAALKKSKRFSSAKFRYIDEAIAKTQDQIALKSQRQAR